MKRGNLNNKVLESNFFFSLYFFYYKLKDIFLCNRHYLLLAYLFILFINLLNQCINPELPNLYIIEDNKTSGSSNAVNYSNVDNSSNIVESSSDRSQYKGVADSIHKQIAEIDKNLEELDSNSADYEKEKEALRAGLPKPLVVATLPARAIERTPGMVFLKSCLRGLETSQ